jgi:hypothetical protein
MSTRPETTRRTIEPAQQTAAKVPGFTYLFALAAVVFAQFGIHARLLTADEPLSSSITCGLPTNQPFGL